VSKVGPYSLGDVLGVGGLGTVYRSSGSAGPVAVKVIHAELADRPGFRTRLLREAAMAQRVSGPGIVRVLDVDAASAQPYLVTEFLDAPTLAEEVRVNGPLSGERLERFANSLMQALGSLHRADVMHRDLKPTNVLVGADGSAHVLDFGLAALTQDAPANEGRGTDGWMAPEIARGEPPTVAADVYGWGLVVAYAASGRLPAAGETDALAAVPVSLRPAVQAALDPNPQRRGAAYVPAAFPTPTGVIPPTELPRPRKSRKRPLLAIVGVGVAAAVLLAATQLRSKDAPRAFVIFDDVFRNGASLNQYNGTNDVAFAGEVHAGKLAISSARAPDPKFFLYLPDGVPLAGYKELHFWSRSDGGGPVSINVIFTQNIDKPVGEVRSAALTETAWTEVVLPLDALIKDRAAYDSATSRMIWISPGSSASTLGTGTILYDDISLR
jgi:serine/threonine protein kinase